MVTMPVVYSERHRGHAPGGGFWLGVRIEGNEEPERGDALIGDLAPVDLRAPEAHGTDPVLAVHDAGLVEFLANAHADWLAAGHDVDPGQFEVVPYVVPRGRVWRTPSTVRARAGLYAGDTMTLIGPGTFDAVSAAVDCSLTAADLVLGGAPAAYAAVRPPGHHTGRDYYGGSCYLNNAAIAARHLLTSGAERVAVVDIDAHHGNGTQDISYHRRDVFYGSVHVDPAAGWYPHYCGHRDETGAGVGRGTNLNVPLAPGTGDDGWLDALSEVVDAVDRYRPDVVVVSLGVDAAAGDPESPLEVTAAGFAAAGSLLGSLGRPGVLVQEGGYDLPRLGSLVATVLDGWERETDSSGHERQESR